MTVRTSARRIRRFTTLLAALALAVLGLVAVPSTASADGSRPQGPCDIYAAGGTPCVAAHSMTRAMYQAYSGPLYRVQRFSDNTSLDIRALKSSGWANAAYQDQFCAGTSCIVTVIYDQTSRHNDLTVEGPGQNGGQDFAANASALPVRVFGHKVYGLYVSAGVGYRDNSTTGVATGSQPEGMYMVAGGQHTNDRCCFDYGNAETHTDDTGNGHMDAINFGTECWFGNCSGTGPWVQADLENGLFAGGNGSYPSNSGRNSTFVTAMLKNNGTSTYAIKDANAQAGNLATRYSGDLPNIGGYTPMSLEGSVVLGTGGDNSNGSVGSFFEGAMTAGYPTNATENAIQANIVATQYTTTKIFPTPGDTFTIQNVHSGLDLDAANCGTGNGTAVDLQPDLGNACQQWAFTAAPNGTYTIANVNSGKVMDAYYCGQGDGTAVDLYTALANKCQQWAVVPAGNNSYMLVVENSGMVLDDVNCASDPGTAADLYQWIDNDCQEWKLTPTS